MVPSDNDPFFCGLGLFCIGEETGLEKVYMPQEINIQHVFWHFIDMESEILVTC